MLSLFRPPSAPAEVFLSKTVRIANPTFRTVSDPEQPVKGWLFKLRKQGAAVLAPHSGKGAILMSASPKARGELLSSSFRLKPFRVVTVTLTWTVELGSPVLFACLRPAKDRFHVDLDFFPRVKPGRTRTASVTLHAGTWGKDYCIAIAVTGTGAARLTGRLRWAVLLLPLLQVALFWGQMNLHTDRAALRWAEETLRQAPPQAVLLTARDDHTFALWYARDVLGERRDVVVLDRDLWAQPAYRRMVAAELGLDDAAGLAPREAVALTARPLTECEQ